MNGKPARKCTLSGVLFVLITSMFGCGATNPPAGSAPHAAAAVLKAPVTSLVSSHPQSQNKAGSTASAAVRANSPNQPAFAVAHPSTLTTVVTREHSSTDSVGGCLLLLELTEIYQGRPRTIYTESGRLGLDASREAYRVVAIDDFVTVFKACSSAFFFGSPRRGASLNEGDLQRQAENLAVGAMTDARDEYGRFLLTSRVRGELENNLAKAAQAPSVRDCARQRGVFLSMSDGVTRGDYSALPVQFTGLARDYVKCLEGHE